MIKVLMQLNIELSEGLMHNPVLNLTLTQVAPILPYLFLVLMLIFRPGGLLGNHP
jgi:branched-chain amino acid transport system permease protein